MTAVRVRFLGSGDAFGSGGRFQTCIHVQAPEANFLIDCGASSLVALRRFRVDPNSIDAILLTHLHGDHFGGVPFFLLDAQFLSRRERPLQIAGPPGTAARLRAAREVLFPGSSGNRLPFPLDVQELPLERTHELGPVAVTPFPADHLAGGPAYALRVATAGRTLTYSGDTAWTEALIPAARDADCLIVECSAFRQPIPYHLDHATLTAHLPELEARRIVVTHMGPEMLAASTSLEGEFAEDGLTIEL